MLGQMESKPTPEPKKRGTMSVKFVDPIEEEKDAGPASLYKSITNLLDGGDKKSIERLAFETDPTLKNRYSTLYVAKQRLIPDTILKRISIQDDLVAAITNTRSGHVGSFGRPRPDRFSVGFVVDARPGVLDELNSTQKEELQNRIEAFSKKLATCGETKGWADDDRLTFSQYLVMSTRDAVTVGRVATEIIYVMGGDGKKKAHSFRPIDAGTIYKAAPHRSAAENLRREARALLEDLKNKRLQPERFVNDEYSWIQVIAEVPKQAFTAKECLVHNFYPTSS